jgi:nitroimidazol reductase NimA-like FMN-containing flavoprotein (pyridoxamine 5'-phosphate oxidase superfamily)
MIVREMSKEECLHVLAKTRLARLACALDNQPYVVPVYLAYHEPSIGESCFYGYSTVGQKVEWMRTNPQVCVEVDEVTKYNRWTSVIAFGRYEELPDLPEPDVGHRPAHHADHHYAIVPDEPSQAAERLLAYQLLQTQALWWEPASTARAALAHRDLADSFAPILYKVSIDRVTGREATPDTGAVDSSLSPMPPVRRFGRLRSALRQIFRGGRPEALSAK